MATRWGARQYGRVFAAGAGDGLAALVAGFGMNTARLFKARQQPLPCTYTMLERPPVRTEAPVPCNQGRRRTSRTGGGQRWLIPLSDLTKELQR